MVIMRSISQVSKGVTMSGFLFYLFLPSHHLIMFVYVNLYLLNSDIM